MQDAAELLGERAGRRGGKGALGGCQPGMENGENGGDFGEWVVHPRLLDLFAQSRVLGAEKMEQTKAL